MTGEHHQYNGHELGQTPRDGEGQGGLVCCSPWDRTVGHNWVTEQQQIVLSNILHGSSGCLNVGVSSGLRVYDHLKTDKGRNLFLAYTRTRLSV